MEGLEEQKVEVAPDISLTVHTGGPADAETIVFLHGFPDYSYTWRYQLGAMLEDGFRVIVPDMRGYNTSSKPAEVADYSMEHLLNDVNKLIEWSGR